MEFKHESLKAELLYSPSLLYLIVEHFEAICVYLRKPVVITRVWEEVQGSSGVHEAHRAVDIRDEHDGKFLFSTQEKDMIVGHMNRIYPRSDGKKVCIWHSFNGGPFHFHIQIPADLKKIDISLSPISMGIL